MWKKVEYTKSEINEAGRKISDKNISLEQRNKYLAIIDNWRAAHAYPTNTFAINLKHKVQHIQGAVVVQRLKRLDTIIHKLERFPKMELYRMQDLGGCRVIVPSISDVYKIVKEMRQSSIRHIEHNYKDYIQMPNPNTGYRGYHLIYKYNSDKTTDYNGLQVEIQIRSQLQHVWATAVETVGIFTDNELKFNSGSEEWLEFFKITSAFFAIKEKSEIVDGVPTNIYELYDRWTYLLKKLDVISTLGTIGMATSQYGHYCKQKSRKKGYYLIKLHLKNLNIEIQTFPNMDAATRAYNEFEKNDTGAQWNGVLVSAQSYEMLLDAYPNYFLDLRKFLEEISIIKDQYSLISDD